MRTRDLFSNALNSKDSFKNTDSFLIGENIYIVGHKNPDLDSIASALGYQIYRHSQGDFNYVAIRSGEVNPVTEWVFKKFNTPVPVLIPNVSGMKLVLVDHTDPESRPEGWENATIIEVLDHHKLKLETAEPSKITIRPYGSTATLVAQKMVRARLNIKEELAGILLSAIIDDTLALRAPTTTQVDKEMAGELALASGIGDLGLFARELFNKKDIWSTLKASEIITMDLKEYEINGKKISISQVETMDNKKLESKKGKDILEELNHMNISNPIDIRMVMLTDLLRNDCILLTNGKDSNILEEVFKTKIENNKLYLPGILSRKKQILPPLMEYYK
jgi:manganese-dependent inorganic pyrophosphatase